MTTLPSSPEPAPCGRPPEPAAADRALVQEALAGDEGALHQLATALTPTIQARVARVLLRRRGCYHGDARARLEDLVQDTFVELFRDAGRVLRAWDPARGLSLTAFVGMVAEQRVLAFVRTRKTSAMLEAPVDDDTLERRPAADAWNPEARAATREQLLKLLDHARAELSPQGRVLFERLIVDSEAIATVASEMSMSTAAVQAWSSRLKRRIAALAEELWTEDDSRHGKESTRS